MKRILILLVFLFLPLLAFGVTGCENQSPEPVGIVFVSENKEYTDYDFGTFYCNDEIGVAVPELYVKYSDDNRIIISADDQELSVGYFYNDGSVNREIERFTEVGFEFSAGTYTVVYTYKDFSVSATLTVKEALTYTTEISETSCRYSEPLPTVTVRNSLGQIESDFLVYYIAKSVYDGLDAESADFTDSLNAASREYDSEYGDILPGEYYVYGKNYKGEQTGFNSLTVTPGILRIAEKGNVFGRFSYNYEYDGSYVFGDILLSQVGVDMDWDNPVVLTNAKGEQWNNFHFEWLDGNMRVNCTYNNTQSVVKIVIDTVEVDGEQIKLYEDLNWGSARMYIERGKVLLWREESYLDTVTYNGEPQQVALPFGIVGMENVFMETATVTRDSVEIVPNVRNGDLVLETVTEIAEYNYVFELRDKTNYRWVQEEEWDSEDKPASENKSYTFTIIPMESQLYRIEDIDQYTKEGDTYRIKVVSGVDEANQVFITPYKADTLTAEILDEYLIGDYTYTSTVEATVGITVINGINYFEINVTEYAIDTDGYLIVRFRAAGAECYADIDETIIIFINARSA